MRKSKSNSRTVKQHITSRQTDFARRVFSVVSKIPRGKTLTYKQVALRAGRPNAFRAVGNILNKNHDPSIPCHRVIRSDGKPGGYNRGRKTKIRILKSEGAL
ncbi:MAG: MGMT family protein [Patescibacteria group bacterium]|nr:MGMT family protein [Patescibacteria group bacterium]